MATTAAAIDWSAADSVEIPWDDGHIPEGLSSSHGTNAAADGGGGGGSTATTMRIYPCHGVTLDRQPQNLVGAGLHGSCSSGSGVVHVVDEAAPDARLADAVYRHTVQGTVTAVKSPHPEKAACSTNGDETSSGGKNNYSPSTWGTYVTMAQILRQLQHNKSLSQPQQQYDNEDNQKKNDTIPSGGVNRYASLTQDQLACEAATVFYQHSSTRLDQATPSSSSATTPTTTTYWNNAHGVAVWALAAGPGSRVPYHMDYAELVRYETGVLVPPVVAGTWHCTRGAIRGGDFCVAVGHYDGQQHGEKSNDDDTADARMDKTGGGLAHYKKHGYKGALCEIYDVPQREYAVDESEDTNSSVSAKHPWRVIPYKFNRMIVQPGHLPHLSTEVEHIADGQLRVIVGFNVFMADVGPFVAAAPEHSAAFVERVQNLRRERSSFSSSRQTGLCLEGIKDNPRLRRALVLAKREKVKQDYQKQQRKLNEAIEAYFLKRAKSKPVTVQDIIDELVAAHSFTVDSLHVHLHHLYKDGVLHVHTPSRSGRTENKTETIKKSKDLIGLNWTVAYPSIAATDCLDRDVAHDSI